MSMKPFMKTCYKCKSAVKVVEYTKEGIGLNCMKCTNCREEFFTSSELIKFDIQKKKITPAQHS